MNRFCNSAPTRWTAPGPTALLVASAAATACRNADRSGGGIGRASSNSPLIVISGRNVGRADKGFDAPNCLSTHSQRLPNPWFGRRVKFWSRGASGRPAGTKAQNLRQNFTRRLSFIPGLRVNPSKGGASLSIGHRGAWYTFGPRGHRPTWIGRSRVARDDKTAGSQSVMERPAHGR